MKKILLVDDDEVIAGIYGKGLSKAGFEVARARDGLEAMKQLSGNKPDIVVLDLMMPKFSGVDVLKFIRSDAALKATPVIIMSNSYMSNLNQAAAAAGADKALLKARCSPTFLVEIVNHLLSGKALNEDASARLVTADYAPTMAAVTTESTASPDTPSQTHLTTQQEAAIAQQKKLHDEFVGMSPHFTKSILDAHQALAACNDPASRLLRLTDLYRKIHFASAMAGMAGFKSIELLTTALDAMLFEVQEKPQHQTASVMLTISQCVELLRRLFEQTVRNSPVELPSFKAMVLDDDAISNRLAVAALRRAGLFAESFEDPLRALAALVEKKYDLVLLDIFMPEMSGFEVCEKIRALPKYQKTPVIFISGQDDFTTRSRSILVGGNDLISKPVFPIELAVKAMARLLDGINDG